MEQRFTLATIFFFTLAGMKPETLVGAGTIYDSSPFKSSGFSSPTLDAREAESVRQKRARKLSDALDQVGAAGVLLDLRD